MINGVDHTAWTRLTTRQSGGWSHTVRDGFSSRGSVGKTSTLSPRMPGGTVAGEGSVSAVWSNAPSLTLVTA